MTFKDKKYDRKLATCHQRHKHMLFLSSSSGEGRWDSLYFLRGLRLDVYNLCVFPLRVLFFRGPRLWGYGFGGGSSPENMCQSFTNVRSEFWSSSDTAQTECFEILESRFHAFVVGAVAFTTSALLIQTMYLTVNRYFLLKPLNEVNRNLEKIIDFIKCNSEGSIQTAQTSKRPQRKLQRGG